RIVQTGPKTWLPGLYEGFSISMYQPSSPSAVIRPEVRPRTTVMAMAMATVQAGEAASRMRSVRLSMAHDTQQIPYSSWRTGSGGRTPGSGCEVTMGMPCPDRERVPARSKVLAAQVLLLVEVGVGGAGRIGARSPHIGVG